MPGVKLNAEVSKELLQTIFQPQTLLHDGAVLIRASRIVSAGVILPLSDRSASRQLGNPPPGGDGDYGTGASLRVRGGVRGNGFYFSGADGNFKSTFD